MSTLDAVVQEVLRRMEASGDKAWLAQDASEEVKLAFIQALMTRPNPNQ